ncbi:SRP54-type protein [Lipomyces tetrasporus]|uniref:Signal recognition particle receptor subunit alpha homolog n=1 Tax=Lipomyces tetrasporus TaxID=54092 RepID=A0AAD7VRH7_9ASCO|nr:SRP54-type protein [Lipomyces tetrasporus]KAJ8098664.1 SRP54-type protein [Lipomyces tetrasporus]
MIDYFTVFTTGGIVLWQKCYQPVSAAIVDSLVSDIFIEDRGHSGEQSSLTKDRYTVKWTTANDFGIIVVAVYQSLLQISFIDELLASVKKLFTTLYGDELKDKDPESLPVCRFDNYFAVRYAELEKLSAGRKVGEVSVPSNDVPGEKVASGDEAEDTSEAPSRVTSSDSIDDAARAAPVSVKKLPLGKRGGRRGGRGGIKARVGRESPFASSGDEVPVKKSVKKLRKWDIDGSARDISDDEGPLDFSTADANGNVAVDEDDNDNPLLDDENVENWGAKTKTGEFILKDLSSEINSILATPDASGTTEGTGGAGAALASGFGFFRNIIGSKVLNEQDLDKALAGMKDHLMKKNVAPEVAQHMCDVVNKSLVGTKTGNWTSIEKTVRAAMEDALRKILTPSTSVDLLHEIQRVKSATPPRPYVISVVGVNGVGKSTNLSKIAFWLLQNNMKLLIAACDTFRSGAVEQLRVHARNLKKLTEREGGEIELFEKGYGKDAANIARDAINYGREHGFDVVLIDTAGRRHNDTRLMSSLEKFAKYANPDKIVMVGEALVGTDSVLQARNFNAAFGPARNLDFFLISKCDTVGDMIGSMVNMTYSTGIPVLFVGTGQMYTDLRTLSVPWAVNMLMG